ncbi:MAG: MMPL family transporter [Treponema sp.]|nr:MMPL family transporter [Treponema sp.]
MKERFSRFLKKTFNRTNKWELYIWIFFHISIPLLLLFSVFAIGPVNINTSLFDMLPQSVQAKSVMEADKVLGDRNGRELVILCAARDFENAKKGAALLYDEYKDSDKIEDIILYFDSGVIDDFYRYLFDYRFVIAANETVELLESGQAQTLAYDALSRAFAAINFFPLDNLDKDPFLLAEKRIGEFLSSSLLSGSMTLKDEVIAAEIDGVFYVLLRMTLAPGSVSLQADKNIIGNIYSSAPAIMEEIPGLAFYFSGIPFHSYESSSGAQKEVSIIAGITLLLILILFLYVFRSAKPVFFSIMAIGISLGTAIAASLLFFREIHIITFVFGTTLIGTCVDYSIHFFIHWKGNTTAQNGAQIRMYVIKNITMSFISTQICFIVFFLSPFAILKQFALFSMAGLLSSYLTFFCIYPRLKTLKEDKRIMKASSKVNLNLEVSGLFMALRKFPQLKKLKPFLAAGAIIAVITLLVVNSSSIKIKNDITSLYTMSDKLLESEMKSAQVLDYGSPGWYFIVSGSSADNVLENEEKLTSRLEEEAERGNLGSFLAASIFVPSQKIQNRTYEAMKALLPLADSQFEYYGFPPEYSDSFKKEFEALKVYCLPQDAPAQAGISNLWIGEIGKNFYTCVMPLHPADESVFRAIAAEFDFVHFINKSKDISADMDTLTRTMLFLFLAAYIIVSIIIFITYPLRDSLKICLVPLILVMVSLTVLAINKISIGFFSAAALVLVFGLSLDYIFFMTGKKSKEEKRLNLTGVTLSFLTTLLSFGALAFSSFMPVHLFGLTVCAGLGAAFISALILQARADPFDKTSNPI